MMANYDSSDRENSINLDTKDKINLSMNNINEFQDDIINYDPMNDF